MMCSSLFREQLVSSGSFVFVNTLHTSCKLVLEGSHFPLLGEYNVTLEPAFWTVVSFSSEISASLGRVPRGLFGILLAVLRRLGSPVLVDGCCVVDVCEQHDLGRTGDWVVSVDGLELGIVCGVVRSIGIPRDCCFCSTTRRVICVGCRIPEIMSTPLHPMWTHLTRHRRFVTGRQDSRRNIRCSENGKVEVGSLSSGDGSTDKHPHLWLSSSDCILSGEDVNINAPLFVPTLSSDSTSSWNKKKEQFEVTILGTMLIPCGLFLEVFELKDNSEGKSYPIDLAQQSFISFTETNMTFTIARSSLSELDGSAEWRGRLVYGSNEKTHNSFQMQRDSSGRFSQTVKENMKWWLPLVIVLSVTALFVIALLIFLIRRRRQKENAKTQQAAEANELDMDIEVLKMEDTSIATTDRVHASSFESPTRRESIATGQKETKRPPESEEGEEDTKKEERVMACGLDGKEVAVVNKYDTLFNRLHHPRAGLDVNKNVVRKQIVCTLKSIVESGRPASSDGRDRVGGAGGDDHAVSGLGPGESTDTFGTGEVSGRSFTPQTVPTARSESRCTCGDIQIGLSSPTTTSSSVHLDRCRSRPSSPPFVLIILQHFHQPLSFCASILPL
ncbi:hypothetical protein BLNAU_23709 [Blattamonas nauphoetae]|uniref:Uncharacterized protein n=1 Tax=Blattamonas nauphoetae TaxID=2049346 RepID=A0ABQ9WPG0_9EUKA|nr:hypothetical protein BLNAU_23709 [Blattamonas nauphoetae]